MRYLLLVSVLFVGLSCGKSEAPVDSDASAAAATPGETSPKAAGSTANVEPPQLLSAEEIEQGWIALFDGHSLFGWKGNSDANWRVDDGVIVADKGEQGLLVTTSPFADFELRCDFRLEKGGNSGIFLRTPLKPTDPAVDCYELNICDSHEMFPSASLVARARPKEPVNVEEEWHTYQVKVEGPQVAVTLDGKPVLEYTDETESPLTFGFIGLQFREGKAEFKNVFLRPLGTKPLFNGEDLTGWREVPGSKSKFEVADSTIRVTNGPGFLETEEMFGDFILQAQAKTNGKHLNSGIFFRALPGTEKAPSHGYEFQIHFGFKDGDRTDPIDSGTGAIFRRVKARRVVGSDNEWATLTLVTNGPHFASWVNGYQVVDWTDEREPKENPREGKRLEPGHFSLQGHDPTTDLNFRNLRVAELPERNGTVDQP